MKNKKLYILIISFLITIFTVYFYDKEVTTKCLGSDDLDIDIQMPCTPNLFTHTEVGFPFHFQQTNGNDFMGIPSDNTVNPEFMDIFKFLGLFGVAKFWLNFVFWILVTTILFFIYPKLFRRKTL